MKEQIWSCKPFVHKFFPERATNPYICRIAPSVGKFEIEWFDKTFDGKHTLSYKKWQSEEKEVTLLIENAVVTVNNLEDETEYEFVIRRVGKCGESTKRLVRTGYVYGDVINYLHPFDKTYSFSGAFLGSPHILRLPSGRLLVSFDVHGTGDELGFIFKSDDDGGSWQYLTELYPAFWTKLFLNNGELYLLTCYGVYGDIVISRSFDDGETWSEPVHILRGERGFAGMHQAPVPVTIYNGRIYTAVECGQWQLKKFASTLMSAPVDCDLMKAENWDFCPLAYFDRANSGIPEADVVTFIEGNVVAAPDGTIYNILRMDPLDFPRTYMINKAIVMKFNSFDEPLEYVKVIEPLCGLRSKFYIQKDEESGKYIMIHNEETPQNFGNCRCVMSMSVSSDLFNWKKVKTLIDYTDKRADTAYSYPSFIIDGDNILLVNRTAFGKPKSAHDNNYLTFHKLLNFREML